MVAQVDVRQLSAALSAGALVLDVREPFEYAAGHVPGAVSMAMRLVPLRMEEIPRDRDVFVICAAGNRSWQVCHFLNEHGIAATNVDGGTVAWQSAGLAIETAPTGARTETAPTGARAATIGGAHS